MDTQEYIALVHQQSVLITQIARLTSDLEAVNKALIPPAPKRAKWSPEAWRQQVKRIKPPPTPQQHQAKSKQPSA